MTKKDVLSFYKGFLKIYANFLNEIAELEDVTNISTNSMENLFNTKYFRELADELPPEQLGLFLKFIVEVTPLFNKYPNPLEIPSSEKKDLFNKIMEILAKYPSE